MGLLACGDTGLKREYAWKGCNGTYLQIGGFNPNVGNSIRRHVDHGSNQGLIGRVLATGLLAVIAYDLVASGFHGGLVPGFGVSVLDVEGEGLDDELSERSGWDKASFAVGLGPVVGATSDVRFVDSQRHWNVPM